MQLPADGDVAERAIAAGGVDAYLQHVLHDTVRARSIPASTPAWTRVDDGMHLHSASPLTCQLAFDAEQKSLRSVSALAKLVGEQQERLRAAAREAPESFQGAAAQALVDVRGRLAEIEGAAAGVLAEYDERRATLARFAAAFAEAREAAAEAAAVTKCRAIADAYQDALQPLSKHAADGMGVIVAGETSPLASVADSVARLVKAVQSVRDAVADGEFGDCASTHEKLLSSLENRTIDAVIKARAAFVNILDNSFRAFGWPMQIPTIEKDAELIGTVNFFVNQLHELQMVAEASEFVSERTRWKRALSDSWAVAPILRAPLARFKYHFLESFRAELDQEDGGDGGLPPPERTATTTRFDRPEWAADFAVERIQEAAPFLRSIEMEGPQTAEIKFVNGFCRVFADKIAYDCELAMRSSKSDSDADALISHSAAIAKQFDAKLRSGTLFDVSNPADTPSVLSLLSENAVFFNPWASSELRLAETRVSAQLEKVLASRNEVGATVPAPPPPPLGMANGDTPTYDIEADCSELLQLVGEAGNGCRHLSNKPLVSSFLRLTELPLLQSVRARLRESLDRCEWSPSTFEDTFNCARAIWCGQVLSELLEDRIFEPFYATFEKDHGFSLYGEEIDRLKSFVDRAQLSVATALSDNFVVRVQADYQPQVRLGELATQDAAVVLAHDLSDALCGAMGDLEGALRGISEGIGNRKLGAAVWRPIAERIDGFFFSDVVMQMFAGGTRNALPAASAANSFLEPTTAAKMARQVAFDAAAVVAVFGSVTQTPQNFLPVCADAAPILQMAARRVIRPKVVKKGQAEMVDAVCRLARDDCDAKDMERAREALEGVFGTRSVTPRECLELFAIAGMQEAIPLS